MTVRHKWRMHWILRQFTSNKIRQWFSNWMQSPLVSVNVLLSSIIVRMLSKYSGSMSPSKQMYCHSCKETQNRQNAGTRAHSDICPNSVCYVSFMPLNMYESIWVGVYVYFNAHYSIELVSLVFGHFKKQSISLKRNSYRREHTHHRAKLLPHLLLVPLLRVYVWYTANELAFSIAYGKCVMIVARNHLFPTNPRKWILLANHLEDIYMYILLLATIWEFRVRPPATSRQNSPTFNSPMGFLLEPINFSIRFLVSVINS